MEHSLPTPDPDSPSPSNLSLQSGSSSVTLRKYAFSTQCVTVESPDASHKDQYNASSVPIYQTATFKGIDGAYDYSRSGNPTRSHLEHHLAKISGAKHAFAVSSGMAALDVITRMLKVGDEVISGDDLYGGTNRLLTYLKEHGGVKVHHVDTTVPSSLLPFLNDKTAMVLLENPTNPLLKIADIPTICELVKERAPQAVIVVDNTMMSPYLQRPLELGADVVYDSGTKYLSGHHDLMAGIVVCDRDDLAKQIAFVINASGNALTPFDAFLLLRGTKTLAIRMDRQQSTAQLVASYLHQLNFVVHYPGLAHHPHRAIHFTSASGAGAVLSFETGDKALSEAIVRGTRLWGISVSFGAVNSLISMPCAMSHASIPAAQRKERGLPEDLIRLCVGIEDPRDLMSDLEQALLRAGALREEDLSVENGVGVGGYVRILPGGPARAAVNGVSRAVEKLRMDEKVGGEVDTLQQGIDRGELSSKAMEKGFLVSAPGKVILFGEHAVVHGVTAIAAAVDLRCYALTTPLDKDKDKLTLTFPELGNFKHTWSINSDLPWSSVSKSHSEKATPELDASLLDAILNSPRAVPESLRGEDHSSTLKRNASLAFLYLYMALCGSKQKRPSLEFTTRSTLPLGAGLGSSASYSTCLAASFLLVNGDISSPYTPSTSEIVNNWAFIGEKILHGNPSGVDNAVAVHGGGMSFRRAGFGREGGMEGIKGCRFKSIALLLTDTKVGRNTKTLVAGVAARKEKEPELINGLMDSIQSISDRAKAVLMDPSISRDRLINELEECINENHAHLAEMGVSHPTLEKVREITRKSPFGLSTKLTGAGGGGCAVTLLPDGFHPALLSKLQDELRSEGFQPYLTSVGGPGFGVFELSKTQDADGDNVTPPSVKDREVVSLASAFETQSQRDVAGFGSHEGTWIYA